jgi:ribonuclease P protein component
VAALRLGRAGQTAAAGHRRLGLRRDLRLRRRADFASVYERGRILNDPLLVLRLAPNGLGHNRYGFVVSKRVGRSVVRNRVRRRLQEIVRLTPVAQGYDVMVSCKAACATAKYADLEAAVRRLFAKGGLLGEAEAQP